MIPLLFSRELRAITVPVIMRLWRVLARTTRLVFRDALERRHEKTAQALSQVFASFINHDGHASRRELEIVYDFVRNVFPDIDLGILVISLESAVAWPQPIDEALKNL